MRTRLASASISLEARVPTKDRPVATQEYVSFELMPTDERDHLDLETGEVFQDYSYARLHKKEKKLIYASMTIRACREDSDYQYNAMRYMTEQTGDDYHYPSSILFNVFIAPTAFRELADNIRSGLFPQVVTIELVDDPSQFFTTSSKKKAAIEFGWEPDGSGRIWHNRDKENQRIAIEGVRFDYTVVKPQYDEKQVDRFLPMQLNAPVDRISEQIALIQDSFAKMMKYLRWITWGVIAFAIMIAIFFIKRGALF
jgi:hypothetical protein